MKNGLTAVCHHGNSTKHTKREKTAAAGGWLYRCRDRAPVKAREGAKLPKRCKFRDQPAGDRIVPWIGPNGTACFSARPKGDSAGFGPDTGNRIAFEQKSGILEMDDDPLDLTPGEPEVRTDRRCRQQAPGHLGWRHATQLFCQRHPERRPARQSK